MLNIIKENDENQENDENDENDIPEFKFSNSIK